MAKKNVYLTQISLHWPGLKYYYFPYSVGVLWEYAVMNDDIKENYDLKRLFWRSVPINEIVDSLEDPYIFGTSHVVWNHNYNYALIKAVKEKFPECIIVVGGPEIADEDPNYFTEHPDVDYCIHREGEISFTGLLQHLLDKKDIDTIPGISYSKNGERISTGPHQRVSDLSNVPSPYATGLFDPLVQEAKDLGVVLNGIIELDRGCPYHCTFCDWGGMINGKVKKFDMSRIESELEWMAQNNIDYIHATVANFGIFKERDMAVADYLIALKEKYNWPVTFDSSWAKNNSEATVEIAEKLMNANMLSKFVSSIQTANPDALAAIKRTNLAEEHQEKIRQLALEKGFNVTTELIIGLPEETYESWQDTVVYCLDKEMWYEWYPLIVYTNSEMNEEEYKKKWGIVTESSVTRYNDYVDETQQMVIGTAKCPPDKFERLIIWTYMTSVLHTYGFTYLIAKYLEKKHSINWQKFYEAVLEYGWNTPESILHFEVQKWIKLANQKEFESFTQAGNSYKEWMHEIGVKVRVEFFSDLKKICKSLVPNDELIEEVVDLAEIYQASENQPKEMHKEFSANLFEYINQDVDLQTKPTKYLIRKPVITEDDWSTFIHKCRYNGYWKSAVIQQN